MRMMQLNNGKGMLKSNDSIVLNLLTYTKLIDGDLKMFLVIQTATKKFLMNIK